jgi:imidazolonepropionase-like amidohydrolase
VKTLIENASLIDGLAAAPAAGMNLLIEDGSIVEIGPAVALDGEGDRIDAISKTVMPGMIDAHLHLIGTRAYDPVLASIEAPFVRAARGVADVGKLIEAGFTSVRCAGSNLGVSLNAAVTEGTIPGPRIVAANLAISQTGGHGDLHMLPLEWMTGPYAASRIADGPDECRKAVREQIRAGAGVIKIMTTGGVLSEKDSPNQPQFVDEEVAAMVEEAHRVGLKVMSHAQSEVGIQLALRNGVDTIEHAIYLDAETIDLLLEKDAVVVPTFAIVDAIVNFGRAAGVPEYALKKSEESHKAHLESIRRAFEAGVKIAAGTDFVGPPGVAHGDNAVELEILVKQVGMSPVEAIASATRIGAEALGLEEEIGTLSVGKTADLLIVDGDPSQDVGILRQKPAIEVVMKSGRVVVDRR